MTLQLKSISLAIWLGLRFVPSSCINSLIGLFSMGHGGPFRLDAFIVEAKPETASLSYILFVMEEFIS